MFTALKQVRVLVDGSIGRSSSRHLMPRSRNESSPDSMERMTNSHLQDLSAIMKSDQSTFRKQNHRRITARMIEMEYLRIFPTFLSIGTNLTKIFINFVS